MLFSFENVHSGPECLFVMACETRPLPVYPIVFRKTQHIYFHSSSCALVSVGVVNLATCVCVKSEEEGLGEKKHLQYFEFGLSILHTAPLIWIEPFL